LARQELPRGSGRYGDVQDVPVKFPVGLMNPFLWKIASAVIAIMLVGTHTKAQDQTPAGATSEPKGTYLLTIFLKDDQSKSLEQINAELTQQGLQEALPPPGIEIVSWYVMAGIGQVVILRVPAERLGEVNRAIKQAVSSSYHTELYPTYDHRAIAQLLQAKSL
jgi:hypothetical protein